MSTRHETISSSRRPTTMCTTPCVPPWCGPTFRNMTSGSSASSSRPHSSGRKASMSCHSAARSGGMTRRPISVARAGRLLAQRVALPPGRHEDRGAVGQAVEAHAEHVPDLALVPGGGREHVGDRGQRGRLALQGDLEPHVAVVLEREQVVDEREVAGRLALAVRRARARRWRSGRRAWGRSSRPRSSGGRRSRGRGRAAPRRWGSRRRSAAR